MSAAIELASGGCRCVRDGPRVCRDVLFLSRSRGGESATAHRGGGAGGAAAVGRRWGGGGVTVIGRRWGEAGRRASGWGNILGRPCYCWLSRKPTAEQYGTVNVRTDRCFDCGVFSCASEPLKRRCVQKATSVKVRAASSLLLTGEEEGRGSRSLEDRQVAAGGRPRQQSSPRSGAATSSRGEQCTSATCPTSVIVDRAPRRASSKGSHHISSSSLHTHTRATSSSSSSNAESSEKATR